MLVEGYLDTNNGTSISGWAIDRSNPSSPVEVEVYLGDVLIGAVIADRFREDLLRNGVGSGRHAFHFDWASDRPGRFHGLVRARIAGTDFELNGSPARRNLSPTIDLLAGDIVNNCNLRCPFCLVDYTNIRGLKLMTSETFAKVIKLLPAVSHSGLWLSCLHEPTLHPQLMEMIDLVPLPLRDRLSFTTNLSRNLPEQFCARLAESKLGSVRVSFDSRNPDVFARLRKGARYEVFEENLTRLVRFFSTQPNPIWIQMITMAFKENYREIPDLVLYCRNELGVRGHDIRFIYYMPHLVNWGRENVLDEKEWQCLEAAIAPLMSLGHITLDSPTASTRNSFEQQIDLENYVARETAFGDADPQLSAVPPAAEEVGQELEDRPLRLRLRWDGLIMLEGRPDLNFKVNINSLDDPVAYFERMRAAAGSATTR